MMSLQNHEAFVYTFVHSLKKVGGNIKLSQIYSEITLGHTVEAALSLLGSWVN